MRNVCLFIHYTRFNEHMLAVPNTNNNNNFRYAQDIHVCTTSDFTLYIYITPDNGPLWLKHVVNCNRMLSYTTYSCVDGHFLK
jgi:hypothetical protein